MDSLDRIDRSNWVPRDAVLSRKARRLKGTYATSDLVNHPELRTRLVRDQGPGSRIEAALKSNKNIVTDKRGFFPDGSRPGGLVSYIEVEVAKADFARATVASDLARAERGGAESGGDDRRAQQRPPFYAAGCGEGPVASLAIDARYGANNSLDGHARHQVRQWGGQARYCTKGRRERVAGFGSGRTSEKKRKEKRDTRCARKRFPLSIHDPNGSLSLFVRFLTCALSYKLT